MNYCPNCGARIEIVRRFCGNCGSPLIAVNAPVRPNLVPSVPYVKPNAFSFAGRSRRSEYWTLILAVAGFCICAVLLGHFWSGQGEEALSVYLLLAAGFGIPLLIWAYAVQVRRCHDLGWSGWFLLIELIPYVGWLAALVFFFAFAFVDGQPGPNRFGPDPKGRPVPWSH